MELWTEKVSIKQVIDVLWVKTFTKSWGEFGLYEWEEKTDWWSWNENKNIVTDFTGKGRSEWWPFAFVKWYLNISSHDTFLWFEDKFSEHKPLEITANKIRNGLNELWENQIGYLATRWIDYNLIKPFVKLYNNSIACLIHKNWIPWGINCRTMEQEHTKRFIAYPWLSTNGVYQWWVDNSKDYLFVVEWLIDFLTLRQYETNVVGLKSAESWLDEITRLSRDFKIIFIFDNDEAWSKTKEKIEWMKYRYFNRSVVDIKAKDVNDLHEYAGELIVDYLNKNLLSDTPISKTIQKFKERQMRLKANHWMLWIDWPFAFYKKTSWIVCWKVYTIWAFSNTGKSKLAYSHASWFLKKWYKVLFVSVEESEEDMFWNIVSAYTWVDLNRLWETQINEKDYENLVLSDTAKTTIQIDDLVKAHNPRIVFIDYAQWLQSKWSSIYEKQSNIAMWIQQIAIQNQCTVFSLSQLSNETIKEIMNRWLENLDIVSLKWAWEYYAWSDVIMVLAREDWETKLQINKNKLWRRWWMYNWIVWWSNNQFNFVEITNSQNDL